MESNPLPQLESVLTRVLGQAVRIQSIQNVSGGCIHHAQLITLVGGRQVFVKSGRGHAPMFAAEAVGLAALEASRTIAIAQVIGLGTSESSAAETGDASQAEAFLVLEPITAGNKQPDFWQQFGQALSALHRTTTASGFGFESDNFIGSTPQCNTWNQDWCEFFIVNRLENQLRMATDAGLATPEMLQLAGQLTQRLPKILVGTQPPSLLHGDLWNGNFLVSADGAPVLIDPAVYYGHREAELSLPMMFGGFPAEFFESYQAAWPLEDDWQERVELYKLYHWLNHLNLFGNSYLGSCMDVLRRFA